MGKLIDADKLIECLNKKTHCIHCDYNSGIFSAIEAVEEQPEAYSPEKVLEALEKEIKPLAGTYNADTPMRERASYKMKYNEAIKKSIEIVKAGGQHDFAGDN